jgi:hypothetical protein
LPHPGLKEIAGSTSGLAISLLPGAIAVNEHQNQGEKALSYPC